MKNQRVYELICISIRFDMYFTDTDNVHTSYAFLFYIGIEPGSRDEIKRISNDNNKENEPPNND